MAKTIRTLMWLVALAAISGFSPAMPAYGHAYPRVAAEMVEPAQAPSFTRHSPALILDQPPNSAPAPNLNFDCLTAADGLSFSLTTSILQDQRGFMWFGTRYGLDKYNGNNISVYLPGPSDDLMGGNYIINLTQDQNGDLWLATSIDLVHWDVQSGEFIHYQPDPANPESLTPGRINAFGRDADGALLIGTNTGLNRYNPATDTFSRYFMGQPVLDIYVDRLGGIWLGTVEGVVYYSSGSLDQPDPVQYQVDRSNPDGPSSNVVTAIYEDRQGELWVGTDGGGLNQLDRVAGKYIPYPDTANQPLSADAPPVPSDNRVWSMLEDGAGRLWIGTVDGLNLLDLTTGNIYQYHSIPGDAHSLINNTVNDLYQDRSGVIWVATLGGICRVNETASHFTHYQERPSQAELAAGAQPGSTSLLSDDTILSVYQDSHGSLWVGTITGGLNRLDHSTGRVTVYQHDPADPTSLSPGEVSAIYEDGAGTLWIGTSTGLNRFNAETEAFEPQEALYWNSIGSIVGDQQGNLWAGAWDGLYRREPGAMAFKAITLDSDLPAVNRIQRLYLDRSGALWIASQTDGLFRLDRAAEGGSNSRLVHFPQKSDDPSSPGTSPVMDMYEGTDGTLWLGTLSDGLVRYDRDTQAFVHFMPSPRTARDDALSHFVSCIEGDAQGNLWMGTALGLARFDPRSETFSNFDARDGLTIGEGISCAQSKEGEMFFGSWQGLNTFYPGQIRDNPNPPAVVITALNLRDKVLRSDLQPDEQVRLPYQENYLSFDFAALDYAAPAKNQYAYKMEGLDADWVMAGTRNHADYPDLKPGSYTFRVKAANNSGVWNEQGAAVRISITPPFWQTWWFLGMLGLVLAGGIAGGVRLRLKSVEARSRELEAQVASRTADLAASVAQLTALQDTAKAVTSTLELDSLLNLIVQQATTLLQADGGIINLVDEASREDEVVATTGLTPPSVGVRTPLDASLSGWVTLHNQAIISNQIPDDIRVARSALPWVLEEHIQSVAAAPLTVRDHVKGTLIVVGRKEGKREFVQADLDLLVAFANQAAIAIENARLYEQSKELAALEERSRLARELHDAVTQTLFSASLVAEALPTTWEKDPEEGEALLQELRGLSRGALAEMRTLLLELRPAALAETRLEDLLRQLGEAASGREGIPVTVQVEGIAVLPAEVHIALYRITQEALNNVVKHARAHQVAVRLCFSCQDLAATPAEELPVESRLSVLLSIRDDGRGFDPAQVPHARLGLGIMQERAQAIGATLTIESQPGHGTQVTVLWEQEGQQEVK